MNFTFYIARRYLFAKKSHNIINIISAISVAGITIGTAALIIVLSVFNGFETLVENLFNSFNPDIEITPVQGKTFSENSIPIEKLYTVDGVQKISGVLEENALVTYKEKQYIVTLKGVSEEFHHTSLIDSMIIEGSPVLETGGINYALVGQGIAYSLGLSLNDYENPLNLYVPRKNSGSRIDPLNAFNNLLIMPSGIFSIQQEYDQKYIIVPLRFTRELLEQEDALSALEVKLINTADKKAVQQKIKDIAGSSFLVKNRFEQEEFLYKVMKSEKLAVFIILSFILLIAIFNVIGSLSMLILDKKKDIEVLKCLGADNQRVRAVFFTEGMMITLGGAVAGLIIGGVVCWLQQSFGLITINTGTFVVESYPVKMMAVDFLLVFITVGIIGLFASWYPAKYISQKHLHGRLS